ncbi:MAG: histidine kinase dimerization/phosphoacceptor domain -containing protein [Gelidibacter sp.]
MCPTAWVPKSILVFFFLLAFHPLCKGQELEQKVSALNPIETTQGFEKLRLYIHQLNTSRTHDVLWDTSFLATLQSAKAWADMDGDATQHLLADYFLLMYDDNHLNNDLVIERGEPLIKQPAFMELPESIFALFALNSSYRRKGYHIQQIGIINKLIEQNQRFGNLARPGTYGYYNELALVYYNLGQYELARQNFKKQAELFEQAHDVFRTSSMLNNVGLTFAKVQETDSARHYYKKAIALLEQPIDDAYFTSDYIRHFKNVVSSNLAKLDLDTGDFHLIETAFKNELLSSKAVKEPRTTAQVYQNLATLYYNHGEFELAKHYNDSTMHFTKQFPNPVNRKEAYLLKAKIALAEQQNDTALYYFERSIAMGDSLNRANEAKNYSEATAKYNFVKTGEALEKNQKLLQEKEDANLIQLVFLCIVAFLSVIIGYMLFKSNTSKKLIATQKDKLQKGLKEKEVMLDEIHHRTKNTLQVVSGILELQRSKIDSETHAKIYEESQNYLQSMSLIHKLLYAQEDVSTINMEDYLQKLGQLLIDHYPNISVAYQVVAHTVQLDYKKANPLALIVCELITNSLKHAFQHSGSIRIQLSKHQEGYRLSYADNGKGFEAVGDTTAYNTGLHLITMLAEDLDGEVQFFNKNGFHCTLNFKD